MSYSQPSHAPTLMAGAANTSYRHAQSHPVKAHDVTSHVVDVTPLYHLGRVVTSRVVASRAPILDTDECCYWDTPITSAGPRHR